MGRPVNLLVILVAVALALLVAAAIVSEGAPAPFARPAKPVVPAPGKWVLTWGETVCPFSLYGNGSCQTTFSGQPWGGSWKWDAATRTLSVFEEQPGTGDPEQYAWYAWSAKLDARGCGRTNCQVAMSLRKVKP